MKGLSADLGAESVVIVVVLPCLVGLLTFDLAGVGLRVGPFGGEGAIEEFDLPIDLGTLGPGPPIFHVLTESDGEDVGPAAGTVVGHHLHNGDAAAGEERVRASAEPGRGLLAPVVQDLRVRDA